MYAICNSIFKYTKDQNHFIELWHVIWQFKPDDVHNGIIHYTLSKYIMNIYWMLLVIVGIFSICKYLILNRPPEYFFDEMQNGAIWYHFGFSYNIESSTTLYDFDRQEFLKIFQNLPFVSEQIRTPPLLCTSPLQNLCEYASILHSRPNISFQTSQYTKWSFSSSARYRRG